jgi:hypothetical protein
MYMPLSFLPTQPAAAQFGVAGGRRQANSNFENLQEMAKQQQDQQGGDGGAMAGLGDLGDLAGLGDLSKLMEQAMGDPETMKMMEEMGSQFGAAMEQLAQMSPEEIEAQMAQAFEALSSGSMVDGLVENREAVLEQLATTQGVPPEELARMRADPAYFELKMRESFDQMKDVFNDPEMMQGMTAAMTGMKDLMGSGGDMLSEMTKLMASGELMDDDKIEEARLQILQGDFDENPMLKEMFQSEEMQELVRDPKKWRDSIKEGTQQLGMEL